MRNLVKLEEMGQFLACAIAMAIINAPWWTYLLLLVGPDIGMLGYLSGPRLGAITYNVLHHKALALCVGLLIPYTMSEYFSDDDGWWRYRSGFILTGFILYGHASMDRIFGYGLKFGDNFHHTHLGWIGKGALKAEG